MSRCTRMCWVEKGGCGRKRVIFNSVTLARGKLVTEKKPFQCLECKKRYSHGELGLKRGNRKPVYDKDVNGLAKALRQHCINVYIQKRREGLV